MVMTDRGIARSEKCRDLACQILALLDRIARAYLVKDAPTNRRVWIGGSLRGENLVMPAFAEGARSVSLWAVTSCGAWGSGFDEQSDRSIE
jgi:hypothetical protein